MHVRFSQGLTGRPGDAGPQGKVGPSVSKIFTTFVMICHASIFMQFLDEL